MNLAEFWYSEAKALGSEANELMGDFLEEMYQDETLLNECCSDDNKVNND